MVTIDKLHILLRKEMIWHGEYARILKNQARLLKMLVEMEYGRKVGHS